MRLKIAVVRRVFEIVSVNGTVYVFGLAGKLRDRGRRNCVSGFRAKPIKMTISEDLGNVCHQSVMHDLKDTWAKSGGLASDFLLYLAADHGKKKMDLNVKIDATRR